MKFLILLVLVFAMGCTDAVIGKFESYNDSARVTCYSGNKLIFDECSTGKVANQSQSDGYFFRARSTQRPVEISGNCVITYNNGCPDMPLLLPARGSEPPATKVVE